MLIVKIGGGQDVNLAAVADDVARVEEEVLIVHGANAERDRLADRLGVSVRTLTSVSGYTSVHTDDAALEVLLMAYAGLRNKRIVELLIERGVRAVGLTGLDGRLISGKRNPGIRIWQGGKKMLVRDRSGKPGELNTGLLRLLFGTGYVPVLTVPIADEQGLAISADNDDIVALLCRELHVDRVVQLIEAPGLLADPADPTSLVPELRASELKHWEQRVEGRMKRKIHAIGKLFEDANGPTVHIGDGRAAAPIYQTLEGSGTTIHP